MKVLLTGSSKGIGYKIANDLLAEGHELALHYNKNESPLSALLKKDKTGSFSIQADLSKQEEIKKMVENTIGKLSFPDCIINNAGIAESADISIDFEKWNDLFDRTIDVNLKAPSLIFKELIKYKRANKIKALYAIILGEEEISKKVIKLKDLKIGSEEFLDLNKAIKRIKKNEDLE